MSNIEFKNGVLIFRNDLKDNGITIVQDKDGVLHFSTIKNCDKLLTHLSFDSVLYEKLSELYSRTINKYCMDTREHSRRYCFGNYMLVIPPEPNYTGNRMITWYSTKTFNQFALDEDKLSESNIQSFSINKNEDGYTLTYINPYTLDFSIFPNSLGGQYRPHPNRGSQDFFEDLEDFYGESIKLVKQ